MARNRGWGIPTFAVAVLVSCGSGADEAPRRAGPPPAHSASIRVESAVAHEGRIESSLTATGVLMSWQEANIRAEVGGRVEELGVRDGDVVEHGQLLARLDGSRQRIAVKGANARVRGLEQDLKLARSDLRRKRTLHERGSIAEFALEQAEIQVDKIEAALAGARAELGSAKRALDDTVVKAPFPGIVTNRRADPGDTVGPGAPMFDVVDLSRVRVRFGLAGSELARLQQGQPVELAISDLGGSPLAAEFASISPSANQATGLFEVEYHADNSEGGARAGMVVTVELPLADGEARVLVPRGAVTRRDGRVCVFEIVEGRATMRPVRTGAYDADSIEIVDGLAAGATVATGSLHTLAEGVGVETIEGEVAAVAESTGG